MKKRISILIMALFALVSVFNYIPVKAAAVPQLQMVTQPATEYHPGERVSFTVTSPNYGGKVEYRVILYNGTTKKTSELWPNMPGYYYKNWQPTGNYKFTINWPVVGMEPGAYSLTVLVRKVGSKAAYESHVKTNAFWIKTNNQNATTPQETSTQTEVKPVVIEKLSEKYYESQNNKLKIRLPEEWSISENKKDDIVSITAKSNKSIASYIMITSAPGIKGASLDMAKTYIYDSFIKGLSDKATSWKEVSKKKIVISNLDAYWYEYSGSLNVSGVTVPTNYYTLFVVNDDGIHVLVAVSYGSDWDNNKSVLEQSLLSFVPAKTDIDNVYKNASSNTNNVTLNTKEDLSNYLKNNYSSLQTSIGTTKFTFEIYENTTIMSPYDFWVMVKYDFLFFYDLQYSNKITAEQKNIAKQELKDFQEKLARDIISKMPTKKLYGGYFYSWYRYPTIKVDLISRQYYSWKNYDEPSYLDSDRYTDVKPSTFRWWDLLDDEL